MNFENLLCKCSERIAVVTINRPRALNSLNSETLRELLSLFEGLRDDAEVDVVILTGAGSKSFVAGADIAAMQPLDPLAGRAFARLGHQVLNAIEKLPQPVIAAVNGFALGGGCELAMACDIRLASENARFGQPEVNLGIIPGFGGTQRLPRLVGKGRAKEIIFTGEILDAAEACRIGLVNRVVPADDLLETARALAAKIVSRGQFAVRMAKEAIDNGLELDVDRAGNYETELFGLCFASADQKEGMAAFLEKRPAVFKGC